MRVALASFLAVALASSVAAAAPGGGGASDSDADEAARVGEVGGVTVYDFEDDNVDGELLSPDGANIASRGRTKHASLITIRPHFIPELIKMANDV
jgi:hypothetical protein